MPNGERIGVSVQSPKRKARTGNNKKRQGRHTVTLHDLEELNDDLGARSDHDLALAGLLTVVDGVEGIVEDGSKNHFCGIETEILKSLKVCEMRYLRRREKRKC
jgi:hypothetical protein